MASINISNFSATIVSFDEITGVDWTLDNPSVVLLLTPNTGFTINASNFSATAPLPTNVSSVVFSQAGTNITCLVTYISPSIMPANAVLIDICASGYAEQTQVTLSGTLKACGTSNVSLPAPGDLPSAYTVSGDFNTTATVLTQSVVASTGFFFAVEPVLALNIGILSNYTITSIKTYNAANQLTQIVFTVVYNFPQTSVSGDEICLTANAEAIYTPAVCINSYSFPLSSPTILAGGQTNTYTLNGIVGASYDVFLVDSAGNVLLNEVGVLDTSGVKVITLVFPASTVDETYFIILTGSCIANGVVTPSQQPSVITLKQYIDTQLIFNFSSTNSDITVGTIVAKTFIPFQNVSAPQSYIVTATSTSNIVLNTTPIANDWSGAGGDFFPTDLTYNSYVNLAKYTINNVSNPKTLEAKLSVVIDQAGTPSLTRILNLDNFITGYQTLQLFYGATDVASCCNGTLGTYKILQSETFTNATVIYNSDLTRAANGFYVESQVF